tara:strand:+ start:1530 stop:3191 length:1662 start_codon:yes stop_codon:yes gene_type:complete
MLSIIVYGRNDNYGYNLHKRAAISLNCLAEILTEESDEILFVDYNTPDDFPTFPEAISDTLTNLAKRRIRILRVRSDEHIKRFGKLTHLKTLEPIARNVALRRSNPNNRWILSTNTDMIIIPRGSKSLSNHLKELPSGIYCTPRFEIPETVWESYNRMDPKGVIKLTKSYGKSLHLNEVVEGYKWIRYDAPGDFQLFERQDLFDIYGFNEEMFLGWHVDSNISKRLFLKYGVINDALPFVFGYHCDHTRQVTPMHRHNSPQNNPDRFIFQVKKSKVEKQSKKWGLSSVNIEEISLNKSFSDRYCKELKNIIAPEQKQLINSSYTPDKYDKEVLYPKHTLPFLVDLFSSMPRDIRIIWAGELDELFILFSKSLSYLNFKHQVEVLKVGKSKKMILKRADNIIFNFGDYKKFDNKEKQIIFEYNFILNSEKGRIINGKNPRRIITINGLNNRFTNLIETTIIATKTPFSSRIRHGFVNEKIKYDHSYYWKEDFDFTKAKKYIYGNKILHKILINLRKTFLISLLRNEHNGLTSLGKFISIFIIFFGKKIEKFLKN